MGPPLLGCKEHVFAQGVLSLKALSHLLMELGAGSAL